jgi:hypothetical protein
LPCFIVDVWRPQTPFHLENKANKLAFEKEKEMFKLFSIFFSQYAYLIESDEFFSARSQLANQKLW